MMADSTSPTNIDIQLLSGTSGEATGIEGLALEIQSALQQCMSMTKSIYSGATRIREIDDPEIPDSRHFSFRVTDSGPMDDMRARYEEWHQRLSELPQHLRGLFTLSIAVRQ